MRMTKRAWSVELESNAWQDDTFNGTVNECIKYCQKKTSLLMVLMQDLQKLKLTTMDALHIVLIS